ncbi:MAG TPA: 50S ribosomal protein L10 [Gemmatales bacterium]|nr:50S ribosomal protein L10 [Gemmatales bacterium]
MSKLIKKMQMDALSQSLGETRDLVLLGMSGVPAREENAMRLALRKKNVRLQLVKNALARVVLKDKGFSGLDNYLNGLTVIAFIKKFSKQISAKIAVAEGSLVDFETAKRMPTRAEALSTVASAILGPGKQLAAAMVGPGRTLGGAIKSLEEKGKPNS